MGKFREFRLKAKFHFKYFRLLWVKESLYFPFFGSRQFKALVGVGVTCMLDPKTPKMRILLNFITEHWPIVGIIISIWPMTPKFSFASW